MSTILSRLDATTNTHATIASAHARHAIARAKLTNSDRRVLKSARAPIVKKALDKNITVLKDFDFKTCRQLNEKKQWFEEVYENSCFHFFYFLHYT